MVARFPLCERRQLELAVASRLDDRESHELAQHLPTARIAARSWSSSPAAPIGGRMRGHFSARRRTSIGVDATMVRPWWRNPRSIFSSRPTIRRCSGGSEATTSRTSSAAAAWASCSRPTTRPWRARWRSRCSRRRWRSAPRPASDLPAKPQAAAAVVHDHVIPIHCVEIAGPVPYLVMPYVTGRSLQERLERRAAGDRRSPADRDADGRGLAAAHAQGLVHRDIKPANILLENGVERVRITDFGLARAVDDASQTQSGVIAGTPQYMAPEQARGEAVDARADLFSLGSVLYAMCTGHPPFRAETTLAVLRRICDDATAAGSRSESRRAGVAGRDHPQAARQSAGGAISIGGRSCDAAGALAGAFAAADGDCTASGHHRITRGQEVHNNSLHSPGLPASARRLSCQLAVMATVAWQWRDVDAARSDPWVPADFSR